LQFPKMPDMLEGAQKSAAPAELEMGGGAGGGTNSGSWNMDSFDPIPSHTAGEGPDEFQEVPLPPPPKVDQLMEAETEEESEATQWSAKSLTRFQVNVPEDQRDEMDIQVDEGEVDEIETEEAAPPASARESRLQPQSQSQSQSHSSPRIASAPKKANAKPNLE